MKVLFNILTFVFVSLSCVAQEKLSLSNVTLELPLGAKKITKEQAVSHIANKLNNDKVTMASVSKASILKHYLTNNVLISFNTSDIAVHVNHLSDMKKGLDELYRGNESYRSEIKELADKTIVIIKFSIGSSLYNRFFSYNRKFTRAVTGTLEYDKNNEEEGKSAMNMIVKTLKFNN